MKKKEHVSLSSNPKEAREAWGAAGAEDPSLSTFDVSLTSIYNLTDDVGYQGSRELTSEEDPGLARSKRRKRSKVATVRPRRDKAKDEDADEEDEDAENEGPPRAARSPRVRRKRHPSSRTRPLRQEHPGSSESSSSTLTSKTKSSRWSLAGFRRYLCSCCDRRRRKGAGAEAEAVGEAGGAGEPPPGRARPGPGPASEHRPQEAPGSAPRDQEDGQDHPAPM
ncbi:protein PRRC2A-like isoform X2 [Leopardus geoffroyi]|uniref:protein PRRC2A-like isoform X2 n=1 Tax=Leopardus geoffroyi TaxID=46844 RepID=UPI001E261579|nr:protein PRRC2A-like isoform X2 [Leopardus geoffroyi]